MDPLSSARASRNPSNSSSQSASSSTPHYVIATQEITADPDSPLGTTKRAGSTFKGFWNNSVVAVKVLPKETPTDTLFNCVESWQILRHPHVLQVFGVSSLDADPPFIISQYFPNGNASEFLAKNPAADRSKIMFECALGMRYLHGRGLIHGGLKPTNILVAENGQACVADYGMIEIKPSASSTARYFSPEAWKGTISQPSDVFAFAMSSYEIFSSTPPWGLLSESHIYQLVVREDDRPDRPEPSVEQRCGLTDKIWRIMEASWEKDATLRPSFSEIVELWQIWSAEDDPEVSGPASSISVSNSGSGSELVPDDSQSSPNDVQVWRRRLHLNLISSKPPAYGDVSAHRPQLSCPSTTLSSSFADHTQNADPSIDGSDPFSFTSPQSSASRTRNVNSLFSAIPRTLTPLTSVPSLVDEHKSSLSTSEVTSQSSEMASMSHIEGAGLVSPNLDRHLYRHTRASSSILGGSSILRRNDSFTSAANWMNEMRLPTQANSIMSETRSHGSQHQCSPSSASGNLDAVLLAGALYAEVTEGRKQDVIDNYLLKTQLLSSQSDKEAQKLVTAGIVPTVILVLKARAVDTVGLEIVLKTLGILACDPITANTINRTNTTSTLIAIINSSNSDDIIALSAWCISRICRNSEVAKGLIKQGLAGTLLKKGLKGSFTSSRCSAWCLGILVYTDDLAETLAELGAVSISVEHLRHVTEISNATPQDSSAAIYLVARLARSIPLSKSLAKAGCIPLIVHHLSTSDDPHVLNWSARAIGCLQRPSSSDLAKVLLDAGSARALARLPRVLSSEVVEPLGSFAFAIQRLSCAEWGGGTRKALVEAGVVDSLLSALRTSADLPYPKIHIELALATSFLGDVGGAAIRKEIVRAGGIDILKRVSAAGKPEVSKICNMAVTSITGNIWSRNAASAKTALCHNWSGGCPEYQPECPLVSVAEI